MYLGVIKHRHSAALQSVDVGSIRLSSRFRKFKNNIYGSPVWRSARGIMRRMKYEIEFAQL